MGNETSSINHKSIPSKIDVSNINKNINSSNNEKTFQFPESLSEMLDSIAIEIDGDYEHDNALSPKSPTYQLDPAQFAFVRVLGQGASGRVMLCQTQCRDQNANNENTQYFAVKEISTMLPINTTVFNQERDVLPKLSHPNIVQYISSYSTDSYHYLVTEYCKGKDMLSKLLSRDSRRFCEEKCVLYLKQILSAVSYMHNRKKCVHRDLKLDNIMFAHENDEESVKIIDFGFSEIISDPNEFDQHRSGTLHYMAPEILSQTHTKKDLYKSDMWSIGVICYLLVTGEIPFWGKDEEEVWKHIIFGDFEWSDNVELSEECKDFISCLLCVDPEQRLSAEKALNHKWVVQYDDDDAVKMSQMTPIPDDQMPSFQPEMADWNTIEEFLDEIDANY